MNKTLPIYIILVGVLMTLSSPKCLGNSITKDSLTNVLKDSPDSLTADTYYKIAVLSYTQKDYNSSIKYFKKSVQYHLKTGNQKAVINSLNLIGHAYIKKGIYDNALKSYLVALKLSKDLKDNSEKAKIYNSIGRHYGFLNDYEQSLSYHLRSLEIIETLDNNIEMKAKSLNNIGMCYGYLGEVDKSLEYFNQSLPLRYEIGNKEDISILLNNLGYAYSLKEDYNKAFEQINLSLKICEEIADNKGITYALLNLAELHVARKQYHQAIPILLRSLILAQETKLDLLILDSYKFLSDSYEGIGDSKKGLFYHKLFNTIQQRLYKEKLENKLGNVNLLNDLKVKEQEVSQLSKENKIKELQIKSNESFTYTLTIVLAILSFFIIVFHFQKKRLKKANKTLALKNLEVVKNEARLKKEYNKVTTTKQESPPTINKKSDIPKYQKSPLSQYQKDDILDKIMDEIERKKLFLSEDLTLIMLANTISTNKSYISQIINENFGKNFNTFINEYRIIEARNLLSQEENWILTIEAIANSVGFKSISAFNSAFKKFTGITPSYFIDTVKSSSQNDESLS